MARKKRRTHLGAEVSLPSSVRTTAEPHTPEPYNVLDEQRSVTDVYSGDTSPVPYPTTTTVKNRPRWMDTPEYGLDSWRKPRKPSGGSKKGKTHTERVSIVTRSHKGVAKSERYEACAHKSGTSRKNKTCATGPTIACATKRALDKFTTKRKSKCRK